MTEKPGMFGSVWELLHNVRIWVVLYAIALYVMVFMVFPCIDMMAKWYAR